MYLILIEIIQSLKFNRTFVKPGKYERTIVFTIIAGDVTVHCAEDDKLYLNYSQYYRVKIKLTVVKLQIICLM